MIVLHVLLFLYCSQPTHDIDVAFYKIAQDSSSVVLEIVVEEAAMQEVVKSSSSDRDNMITSYLDQHFSLRMNGVAAAIDYTEITRRHKHLIIKGLMPHPPEVIKEVNITNTCLLTLEDQSNIIEITLNGSQRDFLMNKNRQSIRVKYD